MRVNKAYLYLTWAIFCGPIDWRSTRGIRKPLVISFPLLQLRRAAERRFRSRRRSRQLLLASGTGGGEETVWVLFLPSRLLCRPVISSCLWRQVPSSSALRWPAVISPAVISYCLCVQWIYGMSMILACYSVRQSKTSFLRRDGLWLQAAALTASSSNLWGGGGSSRGGPLRR